MAKLEEKLNNMNLEETRKYRTKEWIKCGVGGFTLITGLAALPGVLGAGIGIALESPELAAFLGSTGVVGGYVGSGWYTVKKVYNAVHAGYRVKDLEKEDKQDNSISMPAP